MGLTCVFTTKTIIIMQEENEETFVCILIYFPYSTVFHRVEHFGLLFFRTMLSGRNIHSKQYYTKLITHRNDVLIIDFHVFSIFNQKKYKYFSYYR